MHASWHISLESDLSISRQWQQKQGCTVFFSLARGRNCGITRVLRRRHTSEGLIRAEIYGLSRSAFKYQDLKIFGDSKKHWLKRGLHPGCGKSSHATSSCLLLSSGFGDTLDLEQHRNIESSDQVLESICIWRSWAASSVWQWVQTGLETHIQDPPRLEECWKAVRVLQFVTSQWYKQQCRYPQPIRKPRR